MKRQIFIILLRLQSNTEGQMTQQNHSALYIALLRIAADSRFSLTKEIWNLQHSSVKGYSTICRDAISRSLTRLRSEIFTFIVSQSQHSSYSMIQEIARCREMPQVRKNICILYIYGIDSECIAALNCVNAGYVRMCIEALKDDYPDLFR